MSKAEAPGALGVVQAFINTVDLETGEDDLAGPAELSAWLRERGLLAAGADLDEADLRHAWALREALRELLRLNHDRPLAEQGAPPPQTPRVAAAVATLNELAARAVLLVHVGEGGDAALETRAEGLDAAIGRLLAIVYTATVNGTWSRLKVCRNETCVWAFYDWTKNHSGAWCTMRVCGNRIKVRAYQRRHRALG